ncbi:MAG TPA: DUF1634 domain-containing protein [Planctomycetaceae bacterium]|nr:DUF1634 domain-containing protein [Planctomycetaceae bacterium]
MKTAPSQPRLTTWVHWTLSGGVALSGSTLLAGLVMTLATGRHAAPGPPPDWQSLFTQALSGDPPALLFIGLLLLVGTPVLRVFVLAVGWFIEREHSFAVIALVVLALLVSSALLG